MVLDILQDVCGTVGGTFIDANTSFDKTEQQLATWHSLKTCFHDLRLVCQTRMVLLRGTDNELVICRAAKSSEKVDLF